LQKTSFRQKGCEPKIFPASDSTLWASDLYITNKVALGD
jgi:hypothetical protein